MLKKPLGKSKINRQGLTEMKNTRVVKIGNLKVGGKNPVRVKGMLKSLASNKSGLLKEAAGLEAEGAEALRVAVEKEEDIRLGKLLKKKVKIPIAADIHFDYRLGILAIKGGFDQIRLNPLNITNKNKVKEIAKLARDKGISMRIGVNSGGLKKKVSVKKMASEMVGRCCDQIQVLESQKFFDIMVSLKSADIESTVIANKEFSRNFRYPLHLGITATGPYLEGVIKSAAGLGILLNQGIGDIIRVSLTAGSWLEIKAAKYLLQFLNLRKFGPEIISCPTCSRCRVDLAGLVDKFKDKLSREKIKAPLRIAIMGCVVNGPGEASQADLGAAFSREQGVFFKKGKTAGCGSAGEMMRKLIKEAKAYGHK